MSVSILPALGRRDESINRSQQSTLLIQGQVFYLLHAAQQLKAGLLFHGLSFLLGFP